ncbi:MAG: Lrp/AsnC family transcriptional regulator [Nanoarchaeota archaeon]
MENYPKLIMKDMRILNVLDKDPTTSISSIAKKTAVSKQVAEYRLKRLLDQKTIYDFFTVINVGCLGHSLFRLHLKLKNVSSNSYSNFANYLFKNYPIFWIGFVSGSFDIIVDIWAKNSSEFQFYLKDIMHKQKDLIFSYEVFPMLSLSMFSYNYFLPERTQRRTGIIFEEAPTIKLDERDWKVLGLIKNNARMTYEEISARINLTRNAVKRRILELEKKKVITGYHMMVHFQHFERLSYKIFIAYDHAYMDQERSLLDFLESRSGILAYARLLGRWNLDIELQPHNAKELQEFLIDLRNKFNIIQDCELIQIIEDFGLDFFHKKLSIT